MTNTSHTMSQCDLVSNISSERYYGVFHQTSHSINWPTVATVFMKLYIKSYSALSHHYE